eukprot:1155102-Pelagomonas_calceolata.AAC.4
MPGEVTSGIYCRPVASNSNVMSQSHSKLGRALKGLWEFVNASVMRMRAPCSGKLQQLRKLDPTLACGAHKRRRAICIAISAIALQVDKLFLNFLLLAKD